MNGRYAAFTSGASNLTDKGEDDGLTHVFFRDWGSAVGSRADSRADVWVEGDRTFARTGTAHISDPIGDVSTLHADQGADLIAARITHRPKGRDLYVALDLTRIPGPRGLGIAGDPSIVYGLRADADDVSYELRAQRLGAPTRGVSGAAFGVFRCDSRAARCSHVTDIQGGYGTTGESVVMAVPLEALGLEMGGALSNISAFSGLGTFHADALDTLDRVRMK